MKTRTIFEALAGIFVTGFVIWRKRK